ncbi:hypothetical protein NEOKW01_1414 [Nematocida sp. AWRm80]|nr:hypothetical protein NEOKW01_1414 [Nematocida sp. AWRm80]
MNIYILLYLILFKYTIIHSTNSTTYNNILDKPDNNKFRKSIQLATEQNDLINNIGEVLHIIGNIIYTNATYDISTNILNNISKKLRKTIDLIDNLSINKERKKKLLDLNHQLGDSLAKLVHSNKNIIQETPNKELINNLIKKVVKAKNDYLIGFINIQINKIDKEEIDKYIKEENNNRLHCIKEKIQLIPEPKLDNMNYIIDLYTYNISHKIYSLFLMDILNAKNTNLNTIILSNSKLSFSFVDIFNVISNDSSINIYLYNRLYSNAMKYSIFNSTHLRYYTILYSNNILNSMYLDILYDIVINTLSSDNSKLIDSYNSTINYTSNKMDILKYTISFWLFRVIERLNKLYNTIFLDRNNLVVYLNGLIKEEEEYYDRILNSKLDEVSVRNVNNKKKEYLNTIAYYKGDIYRYLYCIFYSFNDTVKDNNNNMLNILRIYYNSSNEYCIKSKWLLERIFICIKEAITKDSFSSSGCMDNKKEVIDNHKLGDEIGLLDSVFGILNSSIECVDTLLHLAFISDPVGLRYAQRYINESLWALNELFLSEIKSTINKELRKNIEVKVTLSNRMSSIALYNDIITILNRKAEKILYSINSSTSDIREDQKENMLISLKDVLLSKISMGLETLWMISFYKFNLIYPNEKKALRIPDLKDMPEEYILFTNALSILQFTKEDQLLICTCTIAQKELMAIEKYNIPSTNNICTRHLFYVTKATESLYSLHNTIQTINNHLTSNELRHPILKSILNHLNLIKQEYTEYTKWYHAKLLTLLEIQQKLIEILSYVYPSTNDLIINSNYTYLLLSNDIYNTLKELEYNPPKVQQLTICPTASRILIRVCPEYFSIINSD